MNLKRKKPIVVDNDINFDEDLGINCKKGK